MTKNILTLNNIGRKKAWQNISHQENINHLEVRLRTEEEPDWAVAWWMFFQFWIEGSQPKNTYSHHTKHDYSKSFSRTLYSWSSSKSRSGLFRLPPLHFFCTWRTTNNIWYVAEPPVETWCPCWHKSSSLSQRRGWDSSCPGRVHWGPLSRHLSFLSHNGNLPVGSVRLHRVDDPD